MSLFLQCLLSDKLEGFDPLKLSLDEGQELVLELLHEVVLDLLCILPSKELVAPCLRNGHLLVLLDGYLSVPWQDLKDSLAVDPQVISEDGDSMQVDLLVLLSHLDELVDADKDSLVLFEESLHEKLGQHPENVAFSIELLLQIGSLLTLIVPLQDSSDQRLSKSLVELMHLAADLHNEVLVPLVEVDLSNGLCHSLDVVLQVYDAHLLLDGLSFGFDMLLICIVELCKVGNDELYLLGVLDQLAIVQVDPFVRLVQ